ncbi:MAG: hypothetical protein Q8R28_12280 [Dehalococcoidia bacterium]|nr:hypothetical protein [Dehalococcoidia bacterium]
MKNYHVYAEDGFESAHRSQAAAERAAKRGSKARGLEYRVECCGSDGFTGGGSGWTVARFVRGQSVPVDN